MKKIYSIIIACGLLFTLPSFAAEYYIDAQNGHDANKGTKDAPWQSYAMINSFNIDGGDTVFLKGTFTADVFVDFQNLSGTAGNPTIIRNWEGHTATFVIQEARDTFQLSSDYFTIQGLTFTGNGVWTNVTPISMTGGVIYNTISDCIIEDAGDYAINANGPISNFFITNNVFRRGSEDIFFLSTAEDTVIMNNQMYTSGTSSITFTNTATNVSIVNNTFVENREVVSFIGSGGTNLAFMNNIVYAQDGELDGLRDGAGGSYFDYLTSDYNIFYMGDDDTPFIGNQKYTLSEWQVAYNNDHNSFNQDPLLVSVEPDGEDAHLTESSPARDAGATIDWVLQDMDEEDRPQGEAHDIGADEYTVDEIDDPAVIDEDETDYAPAKKVKKLKVKKKYRKKKKVRVTWKKHKYKTILKLQKWNKKKKKYKKHKTYRVKKNKKKKVLKGLKKGTKYRVKARKRRTVEGVHYFSGYTKWKKFKTKN